MIDRVRTVMVVGLVVALVACGASSKAATPPSTTTAVTIPPTTIPAGVGPLCAAAALKASDYSNGRLGIKVGATFDRLIGVSLDDCATRIEWLTAMRAYVGNDLASLTQFFDQTCGIDRGFAATIPVPTACKAS